MSTPAGWYPAENGRTRWWDGARWTDQYQDEQPPPPPPPVRTTISAKGVNGTVAFDGDFVTIQRTGALARLSVGKGEKRIPLHSISAVQWKPPGGLMNGFISFSLSGGNEKQSRFGSQTSSAGQDENSVIVTKKQGDEFLALRTAVEEAIAARHRR